MTEQSGRKGFKQMLAEANAVIETIDVQHALKLVNDPNVQFVDIRDGMELAQSGKVPGAVHASRGLLEFVADPESPMHKKELSSGKRLVVYCASGGRSTLATKTLMDMGHRNVCHIAGGFSAWNAAGGPVEK
ncbi:MAG: rhodanese-like domain-containing protein [Hyphomicrobiales bacterium]|nr:rhodanese-like domain-containing protein [Hyphomicrobiales bacterium]